MQAKDLDDYGGPHVDARPLADPMSEVAAAIYDRQSEDTAQLTRICPKATCWFNTDTAAAPFDYLPANVNSNSQWGNGDDQKPTVRKTATGRYSITYATTYTDALGVVETVNFRTARVTVYTSDPIDNLDARPLTCASNAATIVVQSPRLTDADDGDNSSAVIRVVVDLF